LKRYSGYLLLVATTVLSLVLCEAALRLLTGEQVFALKNYRETHAVVVSLNQFLDYDSHVGWVLKDRMRGKDFTTASHGIRRHTDDQDEPRKGAILVTGSSFAAGAEAIDSETWPAQLEKILDRPVENGSVGGFGVDQIVMRAESLLPIYEPRTLVLEVMNTSIEWTGYSHLGFPKPYYTLAGDTLSEHNTPVPRAAPQEVLTAPSLTKSILSHSLLVDRTMSSIDAENWYAQSKTVKVDNDPVAISCALLQRLKRQTDQRGIRAVLVGMVAASDVMPSETAPPLVLKVESCARSMGYTVVSVFEHMRALYKADPNSMGTYYVPHGAAFGHGTPKGNYEVARIVADALKSIPTQVDATGSIDRELDRPRAAMENSEAAR
jgi:hypothetical protein